MRPTEIRLRTGTHETATEHNGRDQHDVDLQLSCELNVCTSIHVGASIMMSHTLMGRSTAKYHPKAASEDDSESVRMNVNRWKAFRYDELVGTKTYRFMSTRVWNIKF